MSKRKSRCTPWEVTYDRSGRKTWRKRCGRLRAAVVQGFSTYTFTITRGKEFVTRRSAKKLSTAKAGATRVMNEYPLWR